MIVISITRYGIGWHALVMLGGMSPIDPSFLEAAEIDGCTYLQEIVYVVVPMGRGAIFLAALMGRYSGSPSSSPPQKRIV